MRHEQSTHRGKRRGLLALALIAVFAYHLERRSDANLLEQVTHAVFEVPVTFVRSGTSTVVEWVGEVVRRERLHEQVRDRDARIATLELENAGLRELRRENERLAELLEMRESARVRARAARVIAGTRAPLRSVVIDLGRDDGVQADSAVLTSAGLVGRVLKIGRKTSVVQLIVDGASGIGGLVERSAVQGVVVGDGASCRLQYVPNSEDVAEGDRIVASGLDGIFPKGATIGVVSSVAPGTDAFRVVTLEPAVAFNRLETVLVLVDRPELVPSVDEGSALARMQQPSAGRP